jgi:hypothetical protein
LLYVARSSFFFPSFFYDLKNNSNMKYVHSAHEDGKFTIPPWPELMRKRVVACSCQDAGILFRAKCTNDVLSFVADSMRSSVNPGQDHPAVQPHWTHLIIDEVYGTL